MDKKVHNTMSQRAYDIVSGLKKDHKEFRSLARSFPSMLQVNGLGGAVAFLYSKRADQKDGKDEKDKNNREQNRQSRDNHTSGPNKERQEYHSGGQNTQSQDSGQNMKKDKNVHEILYCEIGKWLLEVSGNKANQEKTDPETMKLITEMDSADYRWYTDEVMKLCLWIKRFAEGMLEAEVD